MALLTGSEAFLEKVLPGTFPFIERHPVAHQGMTLLLDRWPSGRVKEQHMYFTQLVTGLLLPEVVYKIYSAYDEQEVGAEGRA